MNKAIVTLVKRQIINNDTVNKLLKEMFEAAFSEIGYISHEQIRRYSLNINGRNSQLKNAVDNAATIGSMNAIFKLNGFIRT